MGQQLSLQLPHHLFEFFTAHLRIRFIKIVSVFPLKQWRERTDPRKSSSGRLGLRIFTAKEGVLILLSKTTEKFDIINKI
ncbi:hypothetical protein BSK56_10695 [Paenibacillus borealis]|uniref:Uncharacterized protein n=1 Tax=Paenibacillus borealis TaxID=160799 RepID=A0ABX3HEW9_PAEBO|nr:hypothetical protein BSK56_10695 [Paenibacillus borealis]